jgi:cyclopropane fatty-acyl-phospholipid synthase-like methyltransferase
MDPSEIVRTGYNQVARIYLQERLTDSPDIRLLAELESRLKDGARVLDLGCGAGQPVTARLAERYSVVGIDISEAQIELARSAVPSAEFRRADMVTSDLGESEFDGVCSYYAIIHVPRAHHLALFERIRRALRPGGVALLCLGANDIEADYDEICGAPMFWSHFSADTYLSMFAELAFEIEMSAIVRDQSYPDSSHLFVVVRKPWTD